MRIQCAPLFVQRSVVAALADCWGRMGSLAQERCEAALVRHAAGDAAMVRLLSRPELPASLRKLRLAATGRLAALGSCMFGEVGRDVQKEEAKLEQLASLDRAAEEENLRQQRQQRQQAAAERRRRRDRGGEEEVGGQPGSSKRRREGGGGEVEEEAEGRDRARGQGGSESHGQEQQRREFLATEGAGGGGGQAMGAVQLEHLAGDREVDEGALMRLQAELMAVRPHAGREALPREVYILLQMPQLDRCLEMAGVREVPDEVLLLLVEELVTEAMSQRQAQAFLRTVFLAKVMGLAQPASRALLAAILKASKDHPRAAIHHLVLPLLRQPDLGSAQVEVANRIVKEGLQEAPKLQLLSAILDMHNPSQPGVQGVPLTHVSIAILQVGIPLDPPLSTLAPRYPPA